MILHCSFLYTIPNHLIHRDESALSRALGICLAEPQADRTALSDENKKTGDSNQEFEDPAFAHPMAKNTNVITMTKGHGLEAIASTIRMLVPTKIRSSRMSFPICVVGDATSQIGCVITVRTMRKNFPWSAIISLRPRTPVNFSWSRCGSHLLLGKISSSVFF